MAKKKATERALDTLAAAREVARAVVARQWPELAGVEPTVAPRGRHAPGADDLRRMGAAVAPGARARNGAPAAADEYTFTFAGQIRTPDGYTMPRIARVTVDSHQRVVKATTSK
jgi:hypothetical protein